MKLQKLGADNCKIRDFRPLQGMPLEDLSIGGYDGSIDLSLLEAAPLTSLRLRSFTLHSMEVLQTKNIVNLNLEYTKISSLEALRGLPVKTLRIAQCRQLKDYLPLADLPELEELWVSKNIRLPDTLRTHPKLQWIAVDPSPTPTPITDYWAELDRPPEKGK
jgi:Leucine-rich repeat (LRR) protein